MGMSVNVDKTIQEFNRIHAPAVRAELVGIRERTFTVKFTGDVLYQSCGLYDSLRGFDLVF